MNLTNSEKLILCMLSDIHERLQIDIDNAKLIKDAIYTGNTWALTWELPSIVSDHGEDTPADVTFVCEVLNMWSVMERSYNKLSDGLKSKLAENANPFGSRVFFDGFDGNNEAEFLSITNFLINHLGRFSEFVGRDLNSHAPSVNSYRRMLVVFKSLWPEMDKACLSLQDLIEILNSHRT